MRGWFLIKVWAPERSIEKRASWHSYCGGSPRVLHVGLVVLPDTKRGHESSRTMTRVLVVDDDRSGAMIVSSVLATQGYTVDVAHDGEAALLLLGKCHYDLGIFDFEMPGMNGVALFREARQQQPDLVGIFVTAHTDIGTVFPAIEAGIERVFAKPVNSRELIRVAGELVAGGLSGSYGT